MPKASPPTWKLQSWPIDRLKSYEHNPRAFTTKGMADLTESIDRFGLAEPVVANTDGTVIGGHARLTVMRERGEKRVPVYIPDRTLTPKEVQELNIRLNANIGGEWDWDILANAFDDVDLREWGLDVPEVAGEIGEGVDAEAQIDKADELAKSWGVKPGQLWQCGEHRILCGDSTKPEDVERVMQGERACLVFTDPPYGVSQGAKNRLLETVGKANKSKTIKNNIVDDDLLPDELKARLVPAFTNIRTLVMGDDCTVFVTAPQRGELGMMMMMMMQESGLKVRHMLIWKKDAPTFSMGRLDYDYQHEPILLTWGKRHKRPMKGEHRTSVWEIPKPRSSDAHPTMKPVALVVNALLNNSDEGDAVYDAYSGSGTTMIACEQTGRRARVIEIEPAYVAVALQRFLDATGVKPKLA